MYKIYCNHCSHVGLRSQYLYKRISYHFETLKFKYLFSCVCPCETCIGFHEILKKCIIWRKVHTTLTSKRHSQLVQYLLQFNSVGWIFHLRFKKFQVVQVIRTVWLTFECFVYVTFLEKSASDGYIFCYSHCLNLSSFQISRNFKLLAMVFYITT